MPKNCQIYSLPPGYTLCPTSSSSSCAPACSTPCGPFASSCNPCNPCATGCQGWTGPAGTGVLFNTNGALSLGTGSIVPASSLKCAIAIGPSAGLAAQSANSIAIGGFVASSNTQPSNSIWLGATGAAWGTTYLANSFVVRTQSTINPATAGGFFSDSVKDVVGTANMRYNNTTGEITFDSTI